MGNIFTGYDTYFNSGTINNTTGVVIDVYGLIEGLGNVTGNGTLVSINLTAKNVQGTSALGLYDVGITNETAYIPIDLVNGTVQIDANPPVISNISATPSFQEISGFRGNAGIFRIEKLQGMPQ